MQVVVSLCKILCRLRRLLLAILGVSYSQGLPYSQRLCLLELALSKEKEPEPPESRVAASHVALCFFPTPEPFPGL